MCSSDLALSLAFWEITSRTVLDPFWLSMPSLIAARLWALGASGDLFLHAGVTLWQKMMKANQGGRPMEFLSTHPAEANRVAQIQALLPTVMPLYEQARRR